MSRFKVILIAGLVTAASAGCSSTNGQPGDGAADGQPRDRPSDVAAPGTPFACVGGTAPSLGTGGAPGAGGSGAAATGGTAGTDAASGGPVMCVVGQSFCQVQESSLSAPSHRCMTLSDGGLGVCADNPTCACICDQQITCTFPCSCDDSGGFVTITCKPV